MFCKKKSFWQRFTCTEKTEKKIEEATETSADTKTTSSAGDNTTTESTNETAEEPKMARTVALW